jgi:hypothetical protein
MHTKIEYFDQPLTSCYFYPGYRINIENCDFSKREIINFLSDNFGEGVVCNDCVKFLKIYSDDWYFSILNYRYKNYIIILKTKDQVNRFIDYFDLKVKIDYKTLSVENKLQETLEKHLYELNTQKRRNQIREEVRKILHVKPYDFELIVDEKGIQIKSKNFNFLINGY